MMLRFEGLRVATTFATSMLLIACSGASGRADTELAAMKGKAMQKANVIRFRANDQKAPELAHLLQRGKEIVERTEPKTTAWYGLQSKDATSFAIFDVFSDQAGREAHFAGLVAAAVREQAPALVLGGWDPGVLGGVTNYDVLAATPRRSGVATQGGYIPMVARAGKADELAALLVRGSELVAETEPGTLFWLALRDESHPNHLAIADFFRDQAAVEAHFAGRVATALKEKAADLVEGGWEGGVVAKLVGFEVVANK